MSSRISEISSPPAHASLASLRYFSALPKEIGAKTLTWFFCALLISLSKRFTSSAGFTVSATSRVFAWLLALALKNQMEATSIAAIPTGLTFNILFLPLKSVYLVISAIMMASILAHVLLFQQ